MDLYEMDIQTFTPRLLFQNDQAFEVGKISPDKHFLSLIQKASGDSKDFALFDLVTHEFKNLDSAPSLYAIGGLANVASCFSNDSKKFYYLTNEGSDFTYVKSYDIETQAFETILRKNWDIGSCGFSPDGKYFFTTTNEDGSNHVDMVDSLSQKTVSLPVLADGDITGARISGSSQKLLLKTEGSRTPTNYYLYDIVKKTCRKLTNALSSNMDINDLLMLRTQC
jgi:WD40 repeat protein